MGRYWSMNDGEFNGKFVFGVQPSEDARIFGMSEPQDHAILQTSDVDGVINELKQLFEVADVEFSDDIYQGTAEETKERGDAIYDLVWAREGLPEYTDNKTPKDIENKVKEYGLLLTRIIIGLDIANCIYRQGYCEMDCEY